MRKKYLILKYVNKKHFLISRIFLGIISFFFILITTFSIKLAILSFYDFYNDDFKIGFRRLLKYFSIFRHIELVKDLSFNCCENVSKTELNFLKNTIKGNLKKMKATYHKGDYLHVMAALIEIDKENKTSLIEEFNKISQEIINRSNKEFKIIRNLGLKLTTSRRGDFCIIDAYSALSEWDKIFPYEEYKWFVISGTFLGLIREGNFLKHDYDIDIGIHIKDLDFEEIVSKINLSRNFFIRQIEYQEEGVFNNDRYYVNDKKIVLLKIIYKTGLNIDLFIHYYENGICWHGSRYHRWENKFFTLKEYNLNGLKLLGPKDSNLYLTENYGEWRKPVVNFNYTTGTPNLSIARNPSSLAMFIKRITEFRSEKILKRNKDILKKLKLLNDDVFDIRSI